MAKKKVSYQNLLKEAISEFDTSKTVDVKGPMLDPILKWDGDGELPIFKDAASILERYYFNETVDEGVEVSEMEYNEDGTEKETKEMDHAEGTGTEQAGTSPESSIGGSKKEIAKDLAKEQEEIKADEKDEEGEDEEIKEQEEVDKDEEEKDEEEVEESLENAVIEKLIAEMEDEDEEEEDEKEEVAEGEKVKDEEFEGVAPGMEAPKEKKASGPEQDAQGAGTEQAGTGDAEGQVPDRKDVADKFVKPKNYSEQDEPEVPAEGEEDEEEKDLDIDKEVKEGKVAEAGAAGHVPPPSLQKKAKGEDQGDDDVYEEAFELFKEAIEEGD